MKIAYVAEDGYQHLFPVLAMLRALPGPLFTTGKRLAARATEATTVIQTSAKKLPAALAEHEIDIAISTSLRLSPSQLRGENPRLKVAFINHGESHKTHGSGASPAKSFLHSPVNDEFDLILVASRPHAETYRNPNQARTGYLKHDLFVSDGYGDRTPHPDWVLWAPAWGRHGAVGSWLDDVIEATRALSLRLIIHFHPFSHAAEPGLVQRAQVEVIRHSHVRVAQCANLLDAIAPCAIMLGDVSTSCFDWLMFDRPIIFLDHPGLSVDEERRLFSVGDAIARDGGSAELIAALRRGLANPKARSNDRQAALEQHFFRLDGRAAERAADAIRGAWRDRWSQA